MKCENFIKSIVSVALIQFMLVVIPQPIFAQDAVSLTKPETSDDSLPLRQQVADDSTDVDLSDAHITPEVQSSSIAPTDVGTAFTYQGHLAENGEPATGQFDLSFKLFDSLEAGNLIGSEIITNGLDISSGVFSVELDFGVKAFNGQNRYLEIGVRPADSADEFSTLIPRRNITPSPYSIYADRASGIVSSSGLDALYVNEEDQVVIPQGSDATIEGGGSVIIGPPNHASIPSLVLDNNEIMARKSGLTTTLFLNSEGGEVWIGGNLAMPNGVDARKGGFITLGPINNAQHSNLTIDNNEIMARRSGEPAPLWLNADGGDVYIGEVSKNIGLGGDGSENVRVGGQNGLRVENQANGNNVYIGGDEGIWIDNEDSNAFRTRQSDDLWRKPIFFERFSNLGNNVSFNTEILVTDYECGIAGLAALDGDIQEHDSGDIIRLYTYVSNGTWHIEANFRTHEDDHESWDATLICIDTLLSYRKGF